MVRQRKGVVFDRLLGNVDRDAVAEGTFQSLEGLVPAGDPRNPKWEVLSSGEVVDMNLRDPYVLGEAIEVIDFYYQERPVLGNRYVLVIVDYQDDTIKVVPADPQSTFPEGNYQLGTAFYEVDTSEFSGSADYSVEWALLNEEDISFTIKKGSDFEGATYYLIGDTVYPAVIYPQPVAMYETVQNIRTKTVASANGSERGIITDEDGDKHVSVVYAWRLPSGNFVKHSQPRVLTFPASSAGNITLYQMNFKTLSTGLAEDSYFRDDIVKEGNVPIGTLGQYTTPSESLGEPLIFCSIPFSSAEAAAEATSHFKIGEGRKVSGDVYQWFDREDTIATGEQLNIDPNSHHYISGKTLGKFGREQCQGALITNFAPPGYEWVTGVALNSGPTINNPGIARVGLGSTGEGDIMSIVPGALIATIETPVGTFERYNEISVFTTAGGDVLLPDMVSYPDRRATNIKMYAQKNGDTSRLVELLDVDLLPHPGLNIAFDFEQLRDTDGFASRVSGTEILLTAFRSDAATKNAEVLVESNKARISGLDDFVFPLERTYNDFDSEVFGFVDNTQDVSEGQFGEYPLYILCAQEIRGARVSGGDVFISRIDLIDRDHGVIGREAFTVFRNRLWFASRNGFHALQGSQIIDIDAEIRRLDLADNDYLSGTIEGAVEFFVSGIPEDLFPEVSVAADRENAEVIFCGIYGGSQFVYNLRYEKWYTFTGSPAGFSNSGFPIARQINDRAYLFSSNGGYNINNAVFLYSNDWLVRWRSGNPQKYDYDTDQLQDIDSFEIKMLTNPFSLTDYSEFKRIHAAIIECYILWKGVESDSLSIKLQGRRTSLGDVWTDLYEISRSYSGGDQTEEEFMNLNLRSNIGSMQDFRISIEGEVGDGTWLRGLKTEFSVRNRKLKI